MRRLLAPVAPQDAMPLWAFCASVIWTARQFAIFFRHCRNPLEAAVAFLRRKERAGFIRSDLIDVQSPQVLAAPLHVGVPGEPPPNYHRLSHKCERRRVYPSVPIRVYHPTSLFGKLFGSWAGCAQVPEPAKASHNLQVSEVWLHYYRTNPEVALTRWVPERKLQFDYRRGRFDGPIPDGLILGKHHTTAVEIGGRYPAAALQRHIERFSRARCECGPWHYEIW